VCDDSLIFMAIPTDRAHQGVYATDDLTHDLHDPWPAIRCNFVSPLKNHFQLSIYSRQSSIPIEGSSAPKAMRDDVLFVNFV
jgi:hypothetical protein